jgi:hypothetical protein
VRREPESRPVVLVDDLYIDALNGNRRVIRRAAVLLGTLFYFREPRSRPDPEVSKLERWR